MDAIYVGQLPPGWGIRGNALSQFPQILRVLIPFLIWPNFAQMKVPNKQDSKILKTDQKCSNEIEIKPFHLSPILH